MTAFKNIFVSLVAALLTMGVVTLSAPVSGEVATENTPVSDTCMHCLFLGAGYY